MVPRKLVVGVISSVFLYTSTSCGCHREEIQCFTVFVYVVSGVSVMKNQEEIHISAPMIISNAGIFNTYQKLLPKELQAMPGKCCN